MKLRLVVKLFCVLVLGGCSLASTKTASSDCSAMDWYELGRQDGSAGRPARFDFHTQRCLSPGSDSSTAQYENGREAGLVDFCTPNSFYALGRGGQPFPQVCPALLEENLIVNYRNGKRALEIEIELAEVEREISTLSDQLITQRQNTAHKTKLEARLRELRTARQRFGLELDSLASQIN